MKKVRQLLSVISVFSLILFSTVAPVAGVERHASNENTGAESENTAVIEEQKETEVRNENNADVDNDASAYGYTGENTASYNTGGGEVKTGDASASVNVTTTVNTN
ncbi:MAG TPA: hypothetical protein VJ179_03970, partial [Patescibacteria group bacterium]|nr:hypothetical protein [Patescibacteria group bacterium]